MNPYRTDPLDDREDREAGRQREPKFRLAGGRLIERLRHNSRDHNGYFILTKKRPRS